jgi:hypothetical protein
MLYIQFWAPDDGRRYRLKHVEHFTKINKLCNVASCWLYLEVFQKIILSKQIYFFIDRPTNNKLTTRFGSSELSSGLKQVWFRIQKPFLIGRFLKALLTSHIKQIHIKIVLKIRLIIVVYKKCDLLGHYTASGGDFLPTFRDNLSALIFRESKIRGSQIIFFFFWILDPRK